MWYRPMTTNIDRGGTEVNIGFFRSISHHVQCLNSQQLFYHIISLNKKKQQQQQNLGYRLCLGQPWISFFTWWLTDFIQLKEEWMYTLFVITTADREDPDEMPHNIEFHQGQQCLLRQKWSSGKNLHCCLENKTCDTLNYTTDHSMFIASIQKEEFISSFKSSANYYFQQQSLNHMYMMKHKILWFHAAVTHWIVFTANHANFMLKAHLLWKVSMKSIFSNYM